MNENENQSKLSRLDQEPSEFGFHAFVVIKRGEILGCISAAFCVGILLGGVLVAYILRVWK